MKAAQRLVCIHGHLSAAAENQGLTIGSAGTPRFVYHDWNERITAECYEPERTHESSTSTRQDRQHRQLRANQLNFGPTLLSWMQAHRPRVYEGILLADKQEPAALSGHGSALARV